MSSKRNKLLIFLGLITIVASKSHNQRFHSDFEPTRASARNFSANSHLNDDVEKHNPSTTTSLQSEILELESDDTSSQIEKLAKMTSEEDYDPSTESEEAETQATQVQLHKTRERSKHDSSGIPENSGIGKIHFEAQKINGRKKTVDSKTEKKFSRRTGILIADTDVPDSTLKTRVETEETIEKDNTRDNSGQGEQTPNDGKSAIKKNKKRKKVLRVRVRNQKDSDTSGNSNKNVNKPTQKTKTAYDTRINQKPKVKTSTNMYKPESENHSKDPGIKLRFPGAPREKEQLKPNINFNAAEEEENGSPPIQENKPIINNNNSETTSKTRKRKKTSGSRSVKHSRTSTNQSFPRTKSTSLEMPVQEEVFQSNRDFEAIRKTKTLGRSSSKKRLPKEKQTSIPATNQNYSETKPKYPQLPPKREIYEPNKNFDTFMNQDKEEVRSKSISESNINGKDSPVDDMFPNAPVQKQVFQSNKNIDVRLKETVSKMKKSNEPEKQNSSENKFQMPDTIVQHQNFRANEKVTNFLREEAIEVNPTRNTQPIFHQKKTSEKKFELSEPLIQTQFYKTNQNAYDITKNIPLQSHRTNDNESENKKIDSFFHTNKNLDLSNDKTFSELNAKRGTFEDFPHVKQDNSRIMSKIPNYPAQEEVFESDPNFSRKEQSFIEQKSTNKHEPENKERLTTFYRRTGQKTALTTPQKPHPESDWSSKFTTENQNKDDNSYVVSFNYMGNKGDDLARLSPISTTEKRTENAHKHENLVKSKNSFSGGNLEHNVGKLIEEPKQISGAVNNHKNQGGHFGPNGDSSSFSGEVYGSEELPLSDKNFQEKQYSPSVTLKRKKTKSTKEPVWKLQTKKKKEPDSEWKQTKLGSVHESPTKFDTGFENEKKSSVDGSDYYVRSFMTFPSGENVNINIKKDFPYDTYKEKVTPRKPLLPLENKGTGNYFMHMYKKMGSFENFDIKSSENPENRGYLSSLKLSWTDDDRHARIEESVDSRAYSPVRGHSFSAEKFRTRDYSSRDRMSFQPSENIMQYRPHYVDDFTTPLKNDQSYYFHDIPIMHRRKRSSDNVTQVATHFKIGDFNLENKYTLENQPITKTSGNVEESAKIIKPMPSTLTISPVLPPSGNAGTVKNIPNAPRQHYIKSYYFKPSESRNVALNVSDIFSKYATPSRDRSNFHIFQSYQTPNRDPQQPHDMTYFFREEDKRTEIQLPDTINSRNMHSPKSSSSTSIAAHNNFESTLDRTKVESTHVQASFIKPEILIGSKSPNKTGTNFQTSQKVSLKHKEYAYVPVIEARTDKNTSNPIFQAPWTTMTAAITPPRLKQDGSVQQKEVEHGSHKVPEALFKKDSGQNKIHSQKSLDVQARRIDDDKSWHHPTQEDDDEYKESEDAAVHHSNDNLLKKKQMNNRHRDVQSLSQNDYEQNLNAITSHAPFQWKDALTLDPSSQKKYPTYHSIPKTHFKCKGQAPGYYADPETECQVFHMCHSNGVKHSFLCPNGTIFHQRLLVCDWYTKVHCKSAESFYGVNDMLYKYSPPIKKDYEDQAGRSYRQNLNVVISHSQPRNGNHDQNKQPAFMSTTSGSSGATHTPHLVKTNFKEDVHRSESEKQTNDPISYSPQQKRIINPTFTDQGSYYPNVHDDQRIYPMSLGYRISPNALSGNQEQKNSGKNRGDAVKRERLIDSNRNPTYRNNQNRYSPLKSQRSRNTEPIRNKKVIIPLVYAGNSYYVPNLNGLRYIEDDAHVAGRHNEKLTVINKHKLNPDYDSAESQESKYSNEPEFHDSPTKGTLPVPTPTVAHAPYNNAKQNLQKTKLEPLIIQQHSLNQNENNDKRNKLNPMNEASKYFYENNNPEANQKSNPVNTRAPHYIYPLPGIIQNKDGTREYNYGYRVEDPTAVNLQKAQIIKLTSKPSKTERFVNSDGKSTMDPEKERIQWRIAEIKSGVENIGAQVGKILSGTDNTFKNVRIFKMKPGSSSGELEEITLTPFKSQRQSPNTQSPNLKEQKEILHAIDQKELRSPKHHELEFHSIKQRKPINNPKKLETFSNFKEKNNVNGTIYYDHNNHKQAWKAVPKYPQKVMKNVAPVQKPNKLGYNKNIGELRSYDQVIKVITPNNLKTSPAQSYSKSSHENLKPKYQENIPKLKHSIDDYMDRSNVPVSTKSTSEETEKTEYEIKHAPLKNYDTKQIFNNKNNVQSLPLYQHEKSEHFENTYIPKTIHEMDSSDIIYPKKIILQGPKKVIKTKSNKNQNMKSNTKNTYKNYLVNSDSLKEEFPTTLYDQNANILHTTATPGNNKEMRTFAVLSKPASTMERHSTNLKKEENNNNQQDSIETSRSRHVTKLTRVSNPEPSKATDCDDSVSSNSHDTVSMELGKNGPTHDSVLGGPRKGAFIGPVNDDSRSYNNLPDESTPKCHDSRDGSTPNQDYTNSESDETPTAQITKPVFYNKPTSKAIFKELKRPKYIYGPDKIINFNAKKADESVQLRSKPVKLFQLQRNMRPAFMRPATAIPITAVISNSRHYYRPQEVVTNIKHYNEKRELRPYGYNEDRRELKPTIYYQERPDRKVSAHKHDRRNMRPDGHYERGKQLKPVIIQRTKTLKPLRNNQERVVKHNGNNKGEMSHGYTQGKEQVEPADIQDHKSLTVSSNDNHNKDSKYADIEKAAERLAMQKLQKNKQNPQTNTFPPVRTEPQGQTVTQSYEVSSEQQNNHTRHSRYAALEKEAEQMAQRMFQTKSQTS